MPPEAITSRISNCRIRKGTMTGWPHLLHATGSNGGSSLEIQFLCLHAPQTAMLSGFLLWDASDTEYKIAAGPRRDKVGCAAALATRDAVNSEWWMRSRSAKIGQWRTR